jgi:hypothetical protein
VDSFNEWRADLQEVFSDYVSFIRATVKGGRGVVRRIKTNDLRTYFDPDAVGHSAGSAQIRRPLRSDSPGAFLALPMLRL